MAKNSMTDEQIIKLVKEVKKRSCIWNTEDKNYSDRYHCSTAWCEISTIMDMPEELLRVKWKNLRDFFKKEVKKNKVDEVENYTGRWRHFNALAFLHQPEEQSDSSGDTSENVEVKCEPPNLDVFGEDGEEMHIPEKRVKYDDCDYDMMFLKSLTPFLKQLEPTRNLVVRSKMQDMLLNEIAAQNTEIRSPFLRKT